MALIIYWSFIIVSMNHEEKLLNTIRQVADQIHQATSIGAVNTIITTPKTLNYYNHYFKDKVYLHFRETLKVNGNTYKI